jgi:hypothetical protein
VTSPLKPFDQPWQQFLGDLKTGDIILMHGLFDSSIFIETVFHSEWSHAAVIAIAGDIGVASVPPETVLLWESNIMDGSKGNPNGYTVTDVVLGIQKDGPILDRFTERLTNNAALGYDGAVAKRHLSPGLSAAQIEAFARSIGPVHNQTFPAIPFGELEGYLKGKFSDDPVTDGTFFCSQLAAHTYKAMGLLPPDPVDNAYAPANFAQAPLHADPLLGGFTLGPEIRLLLSSIPPYPGTGK